MDVAAHLGERLDGFTCTDVRFVEVDFPRQLRPRLVIEFSEGLSLLLEDQASIPIAADQLLSQSEIVRFALNYR